MWTRENKPIIVAVILALLFVAVDWWLEDKEIVIQSPVRIRKREVPTVHCTTFEKHKGEMKRRQQEEESVEEKKTSLTSPEAVTAVFAAEEGDNTTSMIKKWARHYGVDEEFALCVAVNESSLDPLAVGDSGKAVGLFQWHLGSWRIMRKKMGLSTVDQRLNPEESARTAMFAIANGYSHWWTPVRNRLCREKGSEK